MDQQDSGIDAFSQRRANSLAAQNSVAAISDLPPSSKPRAMLRSIAAAAWLIFSTIAYGIVVMLIVCISRKAVHCISRMWARHLLWVFGVRVQAGGRENLPGKERCVFVANHQSHLDIPVLLSVIPGNLIFIAKKELFFIPLFGWGMAAAGHIKIDRSSPRKARKSFHCAVKRLKTEHVSLAIFPEGTRSPDGAVGEFKRGSFALVIEAGLKVIPVALCGTSRALQKKTLLLRPGQVFVRFGSAIDATQYSNNADGKEALARRVRFAIAAMIDDPCCTPQPTTPAHVF